jgi:hypothetical protein
MKKFTLDTASLFYGVKQIPLSQHDRAKLPETLTEDEMTFDTLERIRQVFSTACGFQLALAEGEWHEGNSIPMPNGEFVEIPECLYISADGYAVHYTLATVH